MEKKELVAGFKKLDELSKGDYRKSLQQLVAEVPQEEAVTKLTRLIGVSLKEPFAYPIQLEAPSGHSRAYRTWALVESTFEDTPRSASKNWQYRTLEYLTGEGYRYSNVKQLAVDLHHEQGFFHCLARSAQKYVCRDLKFRKQIEQKVKEGKAAGFDVKVFTPEQLIQAGGVALASLLITHVPVLGLVGAPVIAGFVLLLYSIGSDAFCQWVDTTDPRMEIDTHAILPTRPPDLTTKAGSSRQAFGARKPKSMGKKRKSGSRRS
jgi:hypothetical protein